MVEQKITGRLTTILAADVEGQACFVRADEEATLKTLGKYREIFDDLIDRRDGRVFSQGRRQRAGRVRRRGRGGALRDFMPGRYFEPQRRAGGQPEIDVPYGRRCRRRNGETDLNTRANNRFRVGSGTCNAIEMDVIQF